jgi:hypothetical protein
MIHPRYISYIQEAKRAAGISSVPLFAFGSSTRSDTYHDIDLGVSSTLPHLALSRFRDALYESRLPYRTDVVDFTTADKDFAAYVDANEIKVWI